MRNHRRYFYLTIEALLALASQESTVAFTSFRQPNKPLSTAQIPPRQFHALSSSPNDDHGPQDPRLEAMRSLLENSWIDVMGTVPTSPYKAADAAAECVALAMRERHNVLMIDLRLPSYDVTEGPSYDSRGLYEFCSFLSDRLREKKLIRKSLILVRNERERRDIVFGRGEDGPIDETSVEYDSSGDRVGEDADVDEYRKKLMSSWDASSSSESVGPVEQLPPKTSHRLWSTVGDEDITPGSDMFDQVIAAVDKHARLSTDNSDPEDALILMSPFDTTDLIAVRRILARYGQTRTIVIVNSQMEILPPELDGSLLVYGVLPFVGRSRTDGAVDYGNGLKVIVLRRFPGDWCVYVDVYGDGFVQVATDGSDSSVTKAPSSDWILRRVESYLERLSR